MAIDPICGMEVDETKALKAERDGVTHYFCSEHCRGTFLKNGSRDSVSDAHHAHPPHKSDTTKSCCGATGHQQDEHGQHQASARPAHHHHAHGDSQEGARNSAKAYYCPMCPGVESDKPGDCPKCGMALELNPAAKQRKGTIWTCPMHPEIEQDHPGQCPKCGMDLEPKSVGGGGDEEEAATRSLSRKFWIALILTVPVLILAMGKMIPGLPFEERIPHRVGKWLEFVLSAPVVIWAGGMFFNAAGTPSSIAAPTCSR